MAERASLQARLLWGLGSTLVVFLAAYALWTLLALRSLTEDYVQTRLAHDAESLVAALYFDEDGHPRLPPEAVPHIYRRAFSGHYFHLQTPGGALSSRSLWGYALPHPALAPGQVQVFHRRGPLDQPLLVRVAGYRKQGVRFVLTVAEDLSVLERDLETLSWQLGGWSLAVLSLVLLLQTAIVRRGLAPLRRIQAQLRAMEQGERTRLEEGSVPAEVWPLVREVNRSLDHLEARLRRSREAMGDLAHALKGPLTVLGQLLEREELARHPQLQAECRQALERLRQRVERELKRARLAGEGSAQGVFRPAEALPDLVTLVRRIHGKEALEVTLEVAAEAAFRMDREDAMEICGNLLDNAAKWARRRVRVALDEGLPFLRLTVEDDGPGVAPEAMATLLRRGGRLDEQVEGHGLGLAIVRAAAEQYRGEVQLDRSPLGGLRVTVSLPGAPRISPSRGADAGGASG